MPRFPFYKQLDAMDCGPTCLRMIAKYHGKTYSLQTLRDMCHITREGVSLLGISDAAEDLGMRSTGVIANFESLETEVPLPCIAHWKQEHFVVVYKIRKRWVHVADPGHGIVRYTREEFSAGWLNTNRRGDRRDIAISKLLKMNQDQTERIRELEAEIARLRGESPVQADQEEATCEGEDEEDGETEAIVAESDEGILLILEPTPSFFESQDERMDKMRLSFLLSYLRPYKKFLFQLFLGMMIGSMLQLIIPFLTQSVVDYGISHQDMDFVLLVLIAQFLLFVSRASVEFIRSWILLHVSTRINISLISDFLIKLMKLPISFFDAKMTGDIMQRIGDHERIESFLTTSTLNILFSMISMAVFGFVLAIYDMKVFTIFFIGSALYAFWVYLFIKKRRELDMRRFAHLSVNQSNLIQLITGMQEIKLNNCEKQKRWGWEKIQAKLFKVSVGFLALEQYQTIGATLISETKNVLITFFVAKSVMDGEMTLGMMMAVQYIIGQLSGPVEQMLYFFRVAQDAKISMERLGEIHLKEDEEAPDQEKIMILPKDRSITVSNLFFQYEGPQSEYVLEDLSLHIPETKVTAIVGMSGSGKTTLIKLLLGFYPPARGEIKVGEYALDNVSMRMWRKRCGVVMQDGFIFFDTIAKNIAVSDEIIDQERLHHAAEVANIRELIEKELPLGYQTKIGGEGHGLSQGQKQRILIARSVYKNPEYIFFDEATNALDANNERVIMENLEQFFQGRTVVVVAHRLSTVKSADQIVVLDKGNIVEIGTHKALTEMKGSYYHLVKNQLELGN